MLCDEATQQLAKRRAQYAALPPMRLKGKRDPVAAYAAQALPSETSLRRKRASATTKAGLGALQRCGTSDGRRRSTVLAPGLYSEIRMARPARMEHRMKHIIFPASKRFEQHLSESTDSIFR